MKPTYEQLEAEVARLKAQVYDFTACRHCDLGYDDADQCTCSADKKGFVSKLALQLVAVRNALRHQIEPWKSAIRLLKEEGYNRDTLKGKEGALKIANTTLSTHPSTLVAQMEKKHEQDLENARASVAEGFRKAILEGEEQIKSLSKKVETAEKMAEAIQEVDDYGEYSEIELNDTDRKHNEGYNKAREKLTQTLALWNTAKEVKS